MTIQMLDQDTQASAPKSECVPIEFSFEDHAVRTVPKEGGLWFVAADVCAALKLTDTGKAVAPLDDDEKGTNSIRTLGGPQDLLIVSESGRYSLIFKSRKPSAK